jgi:hypothetical protein
MSPTQDTEPAGRRPISSATEDRDSASDEQGGRERARDSEPHRQMVATAAPSAGKPSRAAERPENFAARNCDESRRGHRRCEARRSPGDRNTMAKLHAGVVARRSERRKVEPFTSPAFSLFPEPRYVDLRSWKEHSPGA